MKALLKKQGKSSDPEAVGKVENKSIDGPGGKIQIRIYSPKGDGPFPILVYWHGGGWVLADLDTYDATPRALCNAADCIVVSCHYRQAPEHKFPAAPDDALAAYQWVIKNTKDLKGDAKKIAVAGESAGGNLAAGVAIQAREKGLQMPVHQVLVYPVTDFNFENQSYVEHANAQPLNREMMKWFWGHYLADSKDGHQPRASILRTANLSNLPSATIILAEIDPLRSEGLAYGARLMEAGASAKIFEYEGVAHEFFGMGAVIDKANDAVETAATELRVAFGNKPNKLEGAYTIVSGERDGNPIPAAEIQGSIVKFEGNTIVGMDKDSKVTFGSIFEINNFKKPATIRMTSTAPQQGLSTEGVIQVAGDTVMLCYALPGGETPTTFKTKEKQHCFVLKRVPSSQR